MSAPPSDPAEVDAGTSPKTPPAPGAIETETEAHPQPHYPPYPASASPGCCEASARARSPTPPVSTRRATLVAAATRPTLPGSSADIPIEFDSDAYDSDDACWRYDIKSPRPHLPARDSQKGTRQTDANPSGGASQVRAHEFDGIIELASQPSCQTIVDLTACTCPDTDTDNETETDRGSHADLAHSLDTAAPAPHASVDDTPAPAPVAVPSRTQVADLAKAIACLPRELGRASSNIADCIDFVKVAADPSLLDMRGRARRPPPPTSEGVAELAGALTYLAPLDPVPEGAWLCVGYLRRMSVNVPHRVDPACPVHAHSPSASQSPWKRARNEAEIPPPPSSPVHKRVRQQLAAHTNASIRIDRRYVKCEMEDKDEKRDVVGMIHGLSKK